jgi:hypothetical protein
MRLTRGGQFGSPPLNGSIAYASRPCTVIGEVSSATPDRFDGESLRGFGLWSPAAYVRTHTRVPFSVDGLCAAIRTFTSHVQASSRQGRGRIGSQRYASRFFTFLTPVLQLLSSSSYWIYGIVPMPPVDGAPPGICSYRQP